MRVKKSRPSDGAALPEVIAATEATLPRLPFLARGDDLPSAVDLAIRRHIEAIGDLLRPRCGKCSHPLSAPESISRGVGPICDKAAR